MRSLFRRRIGLALGILGVAFVVAVGFTSVVALVVEVLIDPQHDVRPYLQNLIAFALYLFLGLTLVLILNGGVRARGKRPPDRK